jgi:osmotically inducible protein OsmC
MTSYTAHATTVAGRNGHVESSDGAIRIDLTMPKELGGAGKEGATNPEQLFAAGYSACFGGAIEAVARAEKAPVTKVTVTADVTLHKEDNNFFLSVKLRAAIEGVDRETAQKLVERAHQVCPYSKATRNNIEVVVEAI